MNIFVSVTDEENYIKLLDKNIDIPPNVLKFPRANKAFTHLWHPKDSPDNPVVSVYVRVVIS